MRHNKVILLLILLCAGCSSSQPVINTVIQPDAPVAIPSIQPLTLNPVQWQVMTLAQLQQLAAKHSTLLLFSLDTKNYNNLSLNLIEIERYINEQKAVLTMLKQIVAARSASDALSDVSPKK